MHRFGDIVSSTPGPDYTKSAMHRFGDIVSSTPNPWVFALMFLQTGLDWFF